MQGSIVAITGKLPKTGDTLLYYSFEKENITSLLSHISSSATKEKILEKVKLLEFSGKKNQTASIQTDTFFNNVILIGGGKKKDFTILDFKNSLAVALRKAMSLKARSVCFYGEKSLFKQLKNGSAIGKSFALACALSQYAYLRHKKKEEQKRHHIISRFTLYGEDQSLETDVKKGVKDGIQIAVAMTLTRDLVNEPASHVNPLVLSQRALDIEKQSNGAVTVTILDKTKCEKLGMGAFLGVARGSEHEPKFIVLKYQGKGELRQKKKLCLIGKSITFDSGGLSLKPAGSMEDMKIDMAGGASVLGIFDYLSKTEKQVDYEIWGILPACENMPSGRSLRPGDIVSAMDGTSIEVLNTDAEGRLTLADAVAYAESQIHPDIIIDLATLTGACIVALGSQLTGLFGNDKQLNARFIEKANQEGDLVWELPLHQPYLERMKSKIADLKNIGGTPHAGGGAITAALFIQEFVKKSKWIHLDIAGPAFNNGSSYGIFDFGATGWGIQTIISFIME